MPINIARSIFLVVCALSTCSLCAQWKHIGPFRGTVRAAISFKGATYIGSEGAVLYRTTDGGVTFEHVGRGFPQPLFGTTGNVTGLKVIDGNLYAFLRNMVPYRWNDARWSWEMFVQSDRAVNSTDMVKVGASYFMCSGSNLIEKTSSGTCTSEPMPIGNSYAIVADRASILVVGDTALLRSRDTCKSWTTVPFPSTFRGIRSCLVHAGMIALVGSDGGIRRSTDGGASWDTTNVGLPEMGVVRLWVDNGMFYAVDGFPRLFRSADCRNWSIVVDERAGKGRNSYVTADRRIYAGTSTNGIFISDTMAGQWQRSTEGLAGMQTESFSTTGTHLVARVDNEIWDYDPVSGVGRALPSNADTARDGYHIQDGCVYGDDEHVFDFRLHASKTNDDSVEHVMKVFDRAAETWTRKIASRLPWVSGYDDIVSSFHRSDGVYYTCFVNGSVRMSFDGGTRWLNLRSAGRNCRMVGWKNVVFISGDTYTGITANRGGMWSTARIRPMANRIFFLDSLPAFIDDNFQLTYSADTGTTIRTIDGTLSGVNEVVGSLTDLFVLQGTHLKRRRDIIGKESTVFIDQTPYEPQAIRRLNGRLYVQTGNGVYEQRIEGISAAAEQAVFPDDILVYPQPVISHAFLRVPPGTQHVRLYDQVGMPCDVSIATDRDDVRIMRMDHVVSGVYTVVAEGAFGTRAVPMLLVR